MARKACFPVRFISVATVAGRFADLAKVSADAANDRGT
jgi:hypothetical protein